MADIELTIRIPDAHTARVVNAFTAGGGGTHILARCVLHFN